MLEGSVQRLSVKEVIRSDNSNAKFSGIEGLARKMCKE
jgi:hypothetical protein